MRARVCALDVCYHTQSALMVPHERGNPKMVLLRGEKAQAALAAADEAVERAELVSARLNQSLSLLRSRRDELAQKVESDLARAAISHPDATPVVVAVRRPAPPVRHWKFL